MVLEEKTLDLLALLTTHSRGASLAVPMVPRPPTLAPTRASSSDVAVKKRKRGQGGMGPEGVEAKGARGLKVLRKDKSVNHMPFATAPSQGGPNN